MSQDIKNIETYETITNVNTTKLRPYYDIINKAYMEESKISPESLLDTVKIFQTKDNLYRLK